MIRRTTMCSHISLLCGLALCLSGCTYWSTNRPNTGSYAAPSTFGEETRTFSLHPVLLGEAECTPEKTEFLKRQAVICQETTSPNKALLCADIGIAAIQSGDLDVAEQMLDVAVASMTSVTTTGYREREATSLSGSESHKYFKGEPHERAMTLFFRGLVYLVNNDIDNAQACFRQGALQDATAEDPEHRGDWLVHDLMLLECKKLMHSSDTDEWKEFLKTRYSSDLLPTPFLDSQSVNALVVVCAGTPPHKLALGGKEQLLQYEARPSRIRQVRIIGPTGRRLVFTPTDDIYVQAVTRGSRNMDAILEQQADVRTGVEAAGSVAAGVGAAANVIPGAMLVGGLLKELSWSISDSIDSSADSRQLASIPDKLFLVPLSRDWCMSPLSIELLDTASQVIGCDQLSFPPIPENGSPHVAMITFRY